VTLHVDGGVCRSVAIAHAAVADRSARIEAAEVALLGSRLDDTQITEAADLASVAVEPTVVNYHGDGEYKRDLVRALTKRALYRALENCAA
jgi:carbon-monoxide dehydrogenase medium subunit